MNGQQEGETSASPYGSDDVDVPSRSDETSNTQEWRDNYKATTYPKKKGAASPSVACRDASSYAAVAGGCCVESEKEGPPASEEDKSEQSCADTTRTPSPIRQVFRNVSAKMPTVYEEKWELMFKKLLDYKARFGNTLVPNRYVDDPPLGAWVSTQRRQYKVMVSGTHYESTPLSQERAQRLQAIGFVWKTWDPRRVPWEERFKELVEFKDKFGHCQVPMGYKNNTRLANWVSNQRQERREMLRGKKSGYRRLTQERIEMLDKIGFVWEASRGRAPCPKDDHEGNKSNSAAGGENDKKSIRRKISAKQGTRDSSSKDATVSTKIGSPAKERKTKKKPPSPLPYTNAADLDPESFEEDRSSGAPPFLSSQPEPELLVSPFSSVAPGPHVHHERRMDSTVLTKKEGAPAKKRRKKEKPPSPLAYKNAADLDSESFKEDTRARAPPLRPKPELVASPSSSVAPAPHVQREDRLVIEDDAASLRRHREDIIPLLNGTRCYEAEGRRLVPSTTPLSESKFHNSKDPLERLQLLQAEEELQARINQKLQLRRQALGASVPFRDGTSCVGHENVLQQLVTAGLGSSQTRSNVHNLIGIGGIIDDTPRMLSTAREVALLARLGGLQDQARFDLGALIETPGRTATCATNNKNNNNNHSQITRLSALSTQEIPPASRFWEL